MLVTPLVIAMVLAVIEIGLVAYSRSVLNAAAESAVRTAAAFNGDTTIGEARFRALVSNELRSGAITDIRWYSTLDTLTMRVHSTLPLVGPLASRLLNCGRCSSPPNRARTCTRV